MSCAERSQLSLLIGVAEAAIYEYLQKSLGQSRTIEFLPVGITGATYDRGPLSTARQMPDDTIIYTAGDVSRHGLQLKNTPIVSTGLIVEIDENGKGGQAPGAFSGDALTLGEDYWLDADQTRHIESPATELISRSGILWKETAWPSTPRSVRVTYYGGSAASVISSNLDLLKYAVHLTTMNLRQMNSNLTANGGSGPLQSESLGKYSYTVSRDYLRNFGGTGNVVPPTVTTMLQTMRNYGQLFAG